MKAYYSLKTYRPCKVLLLNLELKYNSKSASLKFFEQLIEFGSEVILKTLTGVYTL